MRTPSPRLASRPASRKVRIASSSASQHRISLSSRRPVMVPTDNKVSGTRTNALSPSSHRHHGPWGGAGQVHRLAISALAASARTCSSTVPTLRLRDPTRLTFIEDNTPTTVHRFSACGDRGTSWTTRGTKRTARAPSTTRASPRIGIVAMRSPPHQRPRARSSVVMANPAWHQRPSGSRGPADHAPPCRGGAGWVGWPGCCPNIGARRYRAARARVA